MDRGDRNQDTQTLVIPRRLPGLNDILGARNNGHAYNALKKQIEEEIYYLCREQGIRRMEGGVHIRFVWHEKNQRRDPDNIVAARKFVLDGLVSARRLAGDGWQHVLSFSDEWRVDKDNPRVEVHLKTRNKAAGAVLT